MLTGENGIIKQAQDAKLQTEIGEEKEAISVAYAGASMKKQSTDVTASDMQDEFNYNGTKANASGNINVQFTESKRWYKINGSGEVEGPFESEDEIITDGVNIIISKTPETEPSGGVLLKVEKVEGLSGDIILDDIDISNLSEGEKKDIIMKIDLYLWNNFDGTNYKSFNELLEDMFESNEQIYWQEYVGDLDGFLEENINYAKDNGIESIPSYTITNPNNEMSDTYLAIKNDVYAFVITDLITGEIYEKSIEVTNIDTNLEYYYVDSYLKKIYLLDKTSNPVDFEKAYIIYNEERIDITSCIEYDESCRIDIFKVVNLLEDIGKIAGRYELSETIQFFELVKNEKSYSGYVLMSWNE